MQTKVFLPFLTLFFLFITSISNGQFSDTAALNQYLRDTLRDRRPAKITAAQIRKGLLGITSFLSNATASSGLTKTGDDIRLGGNLTQATSIGGSNRLDISLYNSGAGSLLTVNPLTPQVYMNSTYSSYTSQQNVQHSGIVTSSRNGTAPNDAEIRQVISSAGYDIYAKLNTEPNVTSKFRINPVSQGLVLGDYINTASKDSLLTTDNTGKLVLVHKNSIISPSVFNGDSQYTSLAGTATTRHTLNATNAEALMGFVDIDPAFPLPAKTFVIQGRDKDDDNNIVARPLVLNPYKDDIMGYNYVGVGTTTPTAPFSVFDGTNGVGLLFSPSTVSNIAQIVAVNYTSDYNTASPLQLTADGVRIGHWNAGLSSASSLTIGGSLSLSVRKSLPAVDYNPFPLNSQFHVLIITNAGQNVDLPAASGIEGRTYKIANYSSGNITTNIPFIIGSGGATTNIIPNNSVIELIATDSNWYRISD